MVPAREEAKLAVVLKNGGYMCSFASLSAGRVAISWYQAPTRALRRTRSRRVLVARGRASFAKAGMRVKVEIKLTARGRGILGQANKRHQQLKLTATGSYTPTGDRAVTAAKTFTLRAR